MSRCDGTHGEQYRGPFSRHGSWLLAWPPHLCVLPDLLRPDGGT